MAMPAAELEAWLAYFKLLREIEQGLGSNDEENKL